MNNFNDPVSNMISSFLNSQKLNLKFAFVCFSKINFFILKTLKSEGYINDFFKIKNGIKTYLMIYIKYFLRKPVIQYFKRVSRPGLRIYKKCKFLPRVMNGLGIAVISTSKGIMSNKTAKNFGLGGEIVCYVF